MGRYVDMHSYDYVELLKGIMDHVNTKDWDMVDSILLAGGTVQGDRYIILNNEHNEEFNSYFTIPEALDKYFNTESTFGKIFCTRDDKFDHKELTSGCDPVDELLENLDPDWEAEE